MRLTSDTPVIQSWGYIKFSILSYCVCKGLTLPTQCTCTYKTDRKFTNKSFQNMSMHLSVLYEKSHHCFLFLTKIKTENWNNRFFVGNLIILKSFQCFLLFTRRKVLICQVPSNKACGFLPICWRNIAFNFVFRSHAVLLLNLKVQKNFIRFKKQLLSLNFSCIIAPLSRYLQTLFRVFWLLSILHFLRRNANCKRGSSNSKGQACNWPKIHRIHLIYAGTCSWTSSTCSLRF